ncbi:MAG: helix-turn-helix transcriptional regulator [Spirochaetaceae bacterium]|nr:helix-turn-helix transcriptional regulator [Spirochaetaceae bacterium]
MLFSVQSGLLDACVLAVIAKNKTYGYKLTQEIKEIMEISDSTLYPVLKRLQKKGFVTSYNEIYDGRNRRYYEITKQGLKQNELNVNEWIQYRKTVNAIFNM